VGAQKVRTMESPVVGGLRGSVVAQQLVTITIPPLGDATVLIAGYDHVDGSIRVLDLGTLYEAQVLAEAKHILGILDVRDVITATLTVAAVITTPFNARLTVPANQVYFIHALRFEKPAADIGGSFAGFNARCSWMADRATPPDADGAELFEAEQGTIAAETVALGTQIEKWFVAGAPLWDVHDLNTELRAEAAQKVTLRAIVRGAAVGAAAYTCTMAPYGYKGKLLL